MAKLFDTFITTVLIADEHTTNVARTVKSVTTILKSKYANYEVLIVDNGLLVKQLESIKKILPEIACVRVIRLAKTDTIDTAVFAGVEAAIGDYICILYNNDPARLIPDFIEQNQHADIVFGVAKNLHRRTLFEKMGTKLFYWYNKKYLKIDIPKGATYYMSLNRSAANALTKNNRTVRHIRHLAHLVGFKSVNYEYLLPEEVIYSQAKPKDLVMKALDIVSGYSNHPLRVLSYFGVLAAVLNLVYAFYVLIVNLSKEEVVEGWTTLSLQSSIMFFFLFTIIAVLAEYLGKVLVEARNEPPYHIMQELSSTISLADQTRRNVTK